MTSSDLKKIFGTARPLVEQWLDIGEQIASLREVATAQGLDWSAVKALLKAQIQDERDDSGDGKRVRKLLERAESAAAYADMLGLGQNMNEKIYFSEDAKVEKVETKFVVGTIQFGDGPKIDLNDLAGIRAATGAFIEKQIGELSNPATEKITERQRASVPHPGPAVQAAAETETGTAAAAPIAEPECHPSGSAMAAGAACNPVPAVIEITDIWDF